MRLSIAALAATISCAAALKGASPLLMFSDSPLPKEINTAQLQSRASLLSQIKAHLSTCPSEQYYIHTLPSVSSSELSAHAPHLKNALQHESVKGQVIVKEVLGLEERDGQALVELLSEKCGVSQEASIGEVLNKGEDRERRVSELDSKLYNGLSAFPTSGKSYTVIILSTPAPASSIVAEQAVEKAIVYESDFMEPLHMDLKRAIYNRAARNESGINRRQPLFEKYNFLSPGLFMGLLVTLILLAILSVGIGAISSLEVSYGAFDKEMGPAAQQKHKQ
ncbi:uncharacterized protein RAG0_04082 [Rhynchosporium agropyri]|uniref:Protein BIG1 n=1 Tax=Rhynchosporium agropyri TaxID=914238 RepID=A0A1E1K7T5_9HELO|nr:uncharacterized protein RAG0_04082 [Rhynchosporium agropyri]